MSVSDPGASASARRVTAAEVARLSGVSRATVSYVLNNVTNQTIPAETRERVRAAAAALGYVPSAAATSLKRGHSNIILVVTDSALSGFVTEPFLDSISTTLAQNGYTPVTYRVFDDDSLVALVREISPFGVLAPTSLSEAVTREVIRAGVPRVYISSQDPFFPRPWEEEIGAAQARHLIERGVSSLIYAAPPHDRPRSIIARSRSIGVERAALAAGFPDPRSIELPPDRSSAATILAAALPADGRVGICTFDDAIAAVTLAAVTDLGLRVPADVAIVGVDDAPFSQFLTPPLTTIAVDSTEMGRELANRFLRGEVSEAESPQAHAITRLVTRAST